MKKLTHLQIDSLPVIITKEKSGLFVISSPVLDIVTQGKNLNEAKKRFEELVIIFFEEITEMGTLEEVLTSLGWTEEWRKEKKAWQPPVVIESSLQEINIPARAHYAQT